MSVSMKELVAAAEKKFRCNCDLDNWEPEKTTGHSHVCRIHKIATASYFDNRRVRKV